MKYYESGGMKDRLRKKIPFPQHQDNYINTLTWIVNIKTDKAINHDFIDMYAHGLNLKLVRKFRDLEDHFVLAYMMDNTTDSNDDTQTVIDDIERKLHDSPVINWFSHQKIVSRQKRWMPFKDPYYRAQWHLTNAINIGMDTNVTGVWQRNITGHGVTVAIVDDGLEWNNPDLQDNYNAAGSWDFNGDDPDPMPDGSKESNHHGTRCAGEVAAVPNNVCAVGVAYRAQVSGLRILDGPMTDSLEAEAFTKHFHINDVYSCSWGPDDDGKTVDGPHFLAAAAMKHGIDFGRHGYGSIYVVASGNGGIAGDNCNYDGYANSIYTVTIGAVDETGHMPFYAEECASMLAVTFSNGGSLTRDIVTTDWTSRLQRSRTGCTEHHTGTSAAAPIAAGLIALMLQVQPCLTWRDIQYIIILTALKVDIDVAHWQKNGAGLWHSHKHGFGLMNAWRLVNAARVWGQVPWLTSFSYSQEDVNLLIPKGEIDPLQVTYQVKESETDGFDLYILETVQVTLTLEHPCRGQLEVKLVSPFGTVSILGAPRPNDKSSAGFDEWTFSTVRCWGEVPSGTWTLMVLDHDYARMYGNGVLKSWELKLYGTPMSQKQLRKRMRLIGKAMDGSLLNSSNVCFPPHVTAPADVNMSVKTLKVLGLLGVFCLVLGIYESLESLLCYNKEKEEHSKYEKLVRRAHQLAGPVLRASRSQETSGLLNEEIPMQSFHSESSSFHHDLESSSSQGQGHSEDTAAKTARKSISSVLNKMRDVINHHKMKGAKYTKLPSCNGDSVNASKVKSESDSLVKRWSISSEDSMEEIHDSVLFNGHADRRDNTTVNKGGYALLNSHPDHN